MGLQLENERSRASKECPAGTYAWAWRAYRGFVKKGDRDYYEFDLNCKAAGDARESVRKMPSLRELGLPQNVFVWSAKDVGTWLDALGLGAYRAAFESNKLQGDNVFLLLESHLQAGRPLTNTPAAASSARCRLGRVQRGLGSRAV